MSIRDGFAALTVTMVLFAGTAAACEAGPGEPTVSTGQPTVPTGPVAGAACVDDRANVSDVVFGQEAGAQLSGLILGSGSVGVVLAHQNGGDVCQWLPFGQELASKGYQVLLFDFAGFGVSPSSDVDLATQVTLAAATLRDNGAGTTLLIGASMGATATLAAAATLRPSVAAAVSFSAPLSFASASAVDAAPSLTVPVLLVAGRSDSQFARAAEQIHAAVPDGHSTLLVVESGEHGWALVTAGIGHPAVRDATFDFIAEHAPPQP